MLRGSPRRSLLLTLALWGCASSQPPAQTAAPAPVAPPTPATVTRAQPGGDASDAHAAALQRLLQEPWGPRGDKDQQVLVPLPDANNWKRVRYWGVEHFLGFRYGAEHHALAVVFVQEVPEAAPSSQDCLRRFEAWGRPQIQVFDVDFDPFHPHHERFKGKSLISLSVDGKLSMGFSRPEFSAAWAAYSLYPNTCLISAIAVPWRKSAALAGQVRDRFVSEGFTQFQPLTETRPVRQAR